MEEESLAEVHSSQETQGREAQDQWSHPFILQGGRRQQSLLCLRLHSQCWINPRSPGFATATAKSLQLCPTLYDPIDSSPPGSSIPGIFQARVLEWGAIAFSILALRQRLLR